MIFVTVGEQLPFDRLIRAVDTWTALSGCKVFAQVGRSNFIPTHIMYQAFLDPEEFNVKLQEAELIVSHAGMGTIISALDLGKSILVMPRQSALGEHRTDHQLATAKRFSALNYISVARDEIELQEYLNNLQNIIQGQKGKKSAGPSPLLIGTIRDLINSV
jgi:UDP-N-acetylglucosamine transferase subunit ALG13